MELKDDIKCPKCRRTLKIPVRQMVPGTSKNCPSCSTVIRFSGDDGRKAQKATDDLLRSIRSMKNIKIDLKF